MSSMSISNLSVRVLGNPFSVRPGTDCLVWKSWKGTICLVFRYEHLPRDNSRVVPTDIRLDDDLTLLVLGFS